jgi:RNA 2',3'-cyclic 3'-phosphodiesterase
MFENDLFPASLTPEAIGFDAIRLVGPTFFAIYPSAQDLPRIVEWQNRIFRQLGLSDVHPRPREILHLSVAECGRSKQQRPPLDVALKAAAERFSYPSFELTLEAIVCFGANRALVAVADTAGTRDVHGLRLALADAQKPFGLVGSREMGTPHLTLGYSDTLSTERQQVDPISFRVEAVDLVLSNVGHTEHLHQARWPLS